MSHVYYCEQLNSTRGQEQREVETTKSRPLRTSEPYLNFNTTIKGRKIA